MELKIFQFANKTIECQYLQIIHELLLNLDLVQLLQLFRIGRQFLGSLLRRLVSVSSLLAIIRLGAGVHEDFVHKQKQCLLLRLLRQIFHLLGKARLDEHFLQILHGLQAFVPEYVILDLVEGLLDVDLLGLLVLLLLGIIFYIIIKKKVNLDITYETRIYTNNSLSSLVNLSIASSISGS